MTADLEARAIAMELIRDEGDWAVAVVAQAIVDAERAGAYEITAVLWDVLEEIERLLNREALRTVH